MSAQQPAVYIAPSDPISISVVEGNSQPTLSVTTGGAAGAVNSVNGKTGNVPILGPIVSDVPYVPTLILNAAVAGHFRVTLTADALLTFTNLLTDGQRIIVEVTQGAGGGHHLTYAAYFNFGFVGGTPTLRSGQGSRNFFSLIWNNELGLLDCVGFL